MSAPTVVVPCRYRHDWALFTDWCTTTGQPALPATPRTLAMFLHERGVAAHHHAHDSLDDVEDRADRIMQNLLTILDGM